MSRFLRIVSVVALALSFGAGEALGSELRAFLAASADAYTHHRNSMFYLRTGNTALVGLELTKLSEKWAAVVARHQKSPPDAFAADPDWKQVLNDITDRVRKGVAALDQGDNDAVKAHLGPIRGLLADLRRRNNIVVFSDYVDRANAAMDRLFHFRRNPPDFSNLTQVDELRRATAILEFLYKECGKNAPPRLRADKGFQNILADAIRSVGKIWGAIAEKSPDRVVSILRELRSFDRFLYLRYG